MLRRTSKRVKTVVDKMCLSVVVHLNRNIWDDIRADTVSEQLAMSAVVVSKTSCKDRDHPILRGVIAPHQEFFFIFYVTKIMIFLDF
jgi:hypothetical protein